MSGEPEDPDLAADRLEAALERIAQAAARGELQPEGESASAHSEEITARLDALIDRLRTVLGSKAD